MNEAAKALAVKYCDPDLMGAFAQAESRGWYGTLYYHPGGVAKAEFLFRKGVCLRCIQPVRTQNTTFNVSTKFADDAEA